MLEFHFPIFKTFICGQMPYSGGFIYAAYTTVRRDAKPPAKEDMPQHSIRFSKRQVILAPIRYIEAIQCVTFIT